MARTKLIDQAARDDARRERQRNVVVDAGAGTGKTKTLVDRVVEMVAPGDDAVEPYPMGRIAAITFTRRAAGELRLRLRQAILQGLAENPSTCRRNRLREALGALDTAFVGTIHSFADRLLRLRPVEAGISPRYAIVEEEETLLAETTHSLLTLSESGALFDALAPRWKSAGIARNTVEAAQAAIMDVLEAGIRAETQESGHQQKRGLDDLVAALVRHRDQPWVEPEEGDPELEVVKHRIGELQELVSQADPTNRGGAWLQDLGEKLGAVGSQDTAVGLLAGYSRVAGTVPTLTKGKDFVGDDAGWDAFKAWKEDDILSRDRLALEPRRWLAARILRGARVIQSVYEDHKSRHEVVDQTDLLIKLRDLLRDNPTIRAFYQELFDHILVDEFQDTDPLQAEILLFLGEHGAKASAWEKVRLAPGRITIVGDPKQSIYRFRRADIRTYARARQAMLDQGALHARLETNFRSRPELVRFFNEQFARILGTPEEGKAIDESRGAAFQEPLAAGPIPAAGVACVHMLPYAGVNGEELKAETGRDIEAEAVARYLRWLVESSGLRVRDRDTDQETPVGYGDVAVLAKATTQLPLLLRALERFGVPFAARGGKMFLKDPLVAQFILALRALADPQDGIGQAALRRPPFFAVDVGDLLAARVEAAEVPKRAKPAAQRGHDVDEFVKTLRKDRLQGPPSATARRLMEESAFARAVALMPNGEQRLASIRELLLALDRVAAGEGLDFDGATGRLREWVEDPIQMDPPAPVASSAVQVLTTHQAKGLEFPIVLLWDGFAEKSERSHARSWLASPDGKEWSITLDRFVAHSESGDHLADDEKSLGNEEHKRLYYVACTRARDLLVIPKPSVKRRGQMHDWLLEEAPPACVQVLEAYRPDHLPPWAAGVDSRPTFPELQHDPIAAAKERKGLDRWHDARAASTAPRAVPTPVSALAHQCAPESKEPLGDDAQLEARADPRAAELRCKSGEGRFGPTFGTTVHAVLAARLRGSPAPVADLVRLHAGREGLAQHHDEATADVQRALAALDQAGLRASGVTLVSEYPLAERDEQGRLVLGILDLVALTGKEAWIIDFKTDAAPAGDLKTACPAYARQVTHYARMLEKSLPKGTRVRTALLFTGEGRVREVG